MQKNAYRLRLNISLILKCVWCVTNPNYSESILRLEYIQEKIFAIGRSFGRSVAPSRSLSFSTSPTPKPGKIVSTFYIDLSPICFIYACVCV